MSFWPMKQREKSGQLGMAWGFYHLQANLSFQDSLLVHIFQMLMEGALRHFGGPCRKGVKRVATKNSAILRASGTSRDEPRCD
jgi:hypothetical protein